MVYYSSFIISYSLQTTAISGGVLTCERWQKELDASSPNEAYRLLFNTIINIHAGGAAVKVCYHNNCNGKLNTKRILMS